MKIHLHTKMKSVRKGKLIRKKYVLTLDPVFLLACGSLISIYICRTSCGADSMKDSKRRSRVASASSYTIKV